MALQATLEIDDKYYNVQDLDYKLSKTVDGTGKPTAKTGGGIINFTVLANDKDNSFFQSWVITLADVKSGSFTLPITDGIDHSEIYVDFKDAFCTDVQVWYSSTNDKQVYMKITISATKIIFRPGGAEYENFSLETTS